MLGEGLVVRQIIRVEDRFNRMSFDLVSGAEYCRDTLYDPAIIFDTLQTLGNGLSGGGRGEKKKGIFPIYHRLNVVPEDHLSAGVKLRLDDIDTLVHIHGDHTSLCEFAGKKSADHVTAIHTDNRINRCAVLIFLSHGRGCLVGFPLSHFQTCHIQIVIDV